MKKLMKLCLLAAVSSIHTVRWANSLVNRGHDVHILTMHPETIHPLDNRINVETLKIPAPFGYYMNQFQAKKIIRKIKPDVLHVHYASGYGTLARLINYQPTLLSVWGSDVFLFPYKSKWAKASLQKNLTYATEITATSDALKKQTEKFVLNDRHIHVVPFGIDLSIFKPFNKKDDTITIGIVKGLEHVYGIDILLRAVANVLKRLEKTSYAQKINVKIVGEGSEKANLQQLASKLNILNKIEFVGAVSNDEVPNYLNTFDIYCGLSRSESFGVSVIEASACKVPVIVSDVGGLPEVVKHNETGFIVDYHHEDKIVDKLYQLITNKKLREQFGENGRRFVSENYNWDKNVTKMENIYLSLK